MGKVGFFFVYTLALALFLFTYFQDLRIFYFAPFLILASYNKSKIACLWLAIICGLIVDLLSAQHRLGIYALNYCLTIMILYSQKQHFFEESLSTFPIMTYFFVVISTLTQVGILYIFGKGFSLSWEWIKDNLFFLPLLDSFYAALAFTFPYLSFPKMSKTKAKIY